MRDFVARLRRPLARSVERAIWGGDRRERFLIALLRRHYEGLLRRQWTLAAAPPHYFDHRIGSFAFATGTGHPYSYYRRFFAAEMVRQGDVLVGSETLGMEGHDHRQFFETLSDLASMLGKYFEHVELRSIDYAIPSGTFRREAFCRCANEPARLKEADWQSYAELEPQVQHRRTR